MRFKPRTTKLASTALTSVQNWPEDLLLWELGDDPNWGGEYLVDISTDTSRAAALAHVEPMIDVCAAKGFDAVEFDNLDSWTRFDGTDLEGDVPFQLSSATSMSLLRARRPTSTAAASAIVASRPYPAKVATCRRPH